MNCHKKKLENQIEEKDLELKECLKMIQKQNSELKIFRKTLLQQDDIIQHLKGIIINSNILLPKQLQNDQQILNISIINNESEQQTYSQETKQLPNITVENKPTRRNGSIFKGRIDSSTQDSIEESLIKLSKTPQEYMRKARNHHLFQKFGTHQSKDHKQSFISNIESEYSLKERMNKHKKIKGSHKKYLSINPSYVEHPQIDFQKVDSVFSTLMNPPLLTSIIVFFMAN